MAVEPTHNFSDRSVAGLIALLRDENPRVRESAAVFLGIRYKDPKITRPKEPVLRAGSPQPELPLPSPVIPSLVKLLADDTDGGVRLAALGALEDLRYRTNTSLFIQSALTNTLSLVRLRAADALVRISVQYHERLPEQAIPTLIACLDPAGNPDEIWQAAYSVGQLGSLGKPAIPSLEKLEKHSSKKVRLYAKEALAHLNAVQ